jgi:DNA-directed RNA polymerase specialized sigma24 family protein
MTEAQFDVLTKLMRGRADSAANLAARAVLVEGVTPAEAAQVLGLTRMHVWNAVRRYRDAHEAVLAAYRTSAAAAPVSKKGSSNARSV